MSRENSRVEVRAPETAEEQVLQLKRLLVTMKQKFEQTLQNLNQQLQAEISLKRTLQIETEQARRELQESKQRHDEEYDSLIQQQILLKDLLQKTQADAEDKLKVWQEGYFQNNQGEAAPQSLPMTPAMMRRLETLEERVRQQAGLQEKYEQVKEELTEATQQLEEALEGRLSAERSLVETQSLVDTQKQQIDDLEARLKASQLEAEKAAALNAEKQALYTEGETRLKVAQQHLAKKVKEVALMTEQIDGLQLHLMDNERTFSETKLHIDELQTQLDDALRQEKRLQEQLHEALKSNESQAAKWEEKYFRMYDKWQESEAQIKELKKLEEKYQQLQSLLSNLGAFMGSTPATPHEQIKAILEIQKEDLTINNQPSTENE